GDVPYLIEEAKKQITLEAKTKGFTDIQSITIQNDSDWDQINLQARNLSLFDDKILFHLQNTSAKFSKKALEILVKQSQQKEFNNIFVIVTDKLMKAQQKTKWYQQIEKDGTVIPVYAFSAHELKQWLQLQLQQANFKTDAHIIQLLADLTEGNLLAAQQAIEKLKLLYPNETLTIAKVQTAISDNARFNVFELANETALGHAKKAIRILNGLKQEGVEPTLILWSLSRQIREITELAEKIAEGQTLISILQSQWQIKQPMLKAALSRLPLKVCENLLQHCAQIDRMIKGAINRNVWEAFELFILKCCSDRSRPVTH
ncbi:MAG: DNA polymerase III subunit delta, partial [Gammaproteobacteria bacterium RIFOXYB2_FULL_38_6]